MRCINIVNFIRAVEPRGPMDLFLPVQKQMETIKRHGFPATWLLQYDAMVRGPFVQFLKENMPRHHEVGLWFEMNEEHCKAAGVKWRGRPGYEWDWSPPTAFSIGYTQEERIKLVDVAAKKFHELWGRYPKSVACWNLDAISMARFADRYGVDAFAVCRDQIATDGYTIWGAPIAGYYPSKTNCWSPAVETKNQINTPVFRMLGQDPVYYYQRRYPLPNGDICEDPDTMEPVWPSGQSKEFVDRFLEMIGENPTGSFAYAQIGQENSFGWAAMKGYELQMNALSALRGVSVETMGETGGRFKKAFSLTPVQAQVQLKDPFGHTDPAEKTVWYQSRFYRANLHFIGGRAFFRDLTVYSDHNPQPFLTSPATEGGLQERMPAVLDGYHWSKSSEEPAMGRFMKDGREMTLNGVPAVREESSALVVDLPGSLSVKFSEREILIVGDGNFSLVFDWDPSKSAFRRLNGKRAEYEWKGFPYSVVVATGLARAIDGGWAADSAGGRITLSMAHD